MALQPYNESYLDKLKSALNTGSISAKARAAGDWFRQTMLRARGEWKAAVSQETPETLLSRQTTASTQIIGKMYFFLYNPKHKKTLPYYDRFPLIFPIEFYNDGFLGLNFHYLHPRDRAILMDQLKTLANNKRYDATTKLSITYNMLQGFSKYKRARPTVHKYLSNHVQSKFVRIDADEWEVALFLPVERFSKASKQKVWSDSKRMF
tara:strand:+ start:490 stop:1110 length:621 start_codon:yes stop_codon:yes gene_type:complete